MAREETEFDSNNDTLNEDLIKLNGMKKSNAQDVWHDIALQKLKQNAQKIRSSLVEQIDSQLACMVDDFMAGEVKPQNAGISPTETPSKKRKSDDLPDKEFVVRESLLTELLEINHIQTIYNIFVSILMLLFLNTVIYDIVETGTFNINFSQILQSFGKPQLVMTSWLAMKCSTMLVYPVFHFWAHNRHQVRQKNIFDSSFLCVFITFLSAFLFFPARVILVDNLPEASSAIIVCEQMRLIMKAYAFVRSNVPRAKKYKPHQDDVEENSIACPDFGKYLYFLFAPTLIYRDNYPRTKFVRWGYVASNLIQVLACLFYTHFVFQRYCVPVFSKFGRERLSYQSLILSVFGCMMPATLVLLINFFLILHSWLNAFAEMLRFGDRLFYKDWWNSTTFANYYRTWNIVVHDWLYTYIYKDVYQILRPNRKGPMLAVFMLSAAVHEYMVAMLFHFCLPIMLFMFGGVGVIFVFLTDKRKSRTWNIFMWTNLFMGTGMMMSVYSMEIFARSNCLPFSTSQVLDFFVPRSLFCQPIPSSSSTVED